VLIADLSARAEFAGIIARDEKRILAGVERFDAFYLTDAGESWNALRAYGRSFRLPPAPALGDWKHIVLAALSLLGLRKARGIYDDLRTRRLKAEK